MQHWQAYLKASHEIIVAAEDRCNLELNVTLESYLVHLVARNFRKMPTSEKPIAIRFLESGSFNSSLKKQVMADIGDECLFIDGFGYRKSKWPGKTYYKDMGTLAYGSASLAPPRDPLYEHLEYNFGLLSEVLHHIRTS